MGYRSSLGNRVVSAPFTESEPAGGPRELHRLVAVHLAYDGRVVFDRFASVKGHLFLLHEIRHLRPLDPIF
jgi:hypothetical protein